MQGLFSIIGMTVGSYLGWRLGAPGGPMAGVLVSAVGAGVGLYAAQRFTNTFRS